MRSFWRNGVALSTALLICVAISLGAAAGEGQDGNSTTQVKAREIAFAKTMADRDFDAFLSFVSTEAIFFNGSTPLRGRDAVAEAWAPFFEGDDAPFSWHPDLVEVLDSDRLALSSGPVFGTTGEEAGRFNSIWRKDADGEWRVVFDKGS